MGLLIVTNDLNCERF